VGDMKCAFTSALQWFILTPILNRRLHGLLQVLGLPYGEQPRALRSVDVAGDDRAAFRYLPV
jgi:hypothetical protein